MKECSRVMLESLRQRGEDDFHRVTLIVPEANSAAMNQWLDDNGEGVWVLEDLYPYRPHGETRYTDWVQTFAFSNRDSAFEFKLRFA
ncbi:MAG: hypothetical protein EOP83_01150 [Verrucomicrobiaceae bacterium]|nr:MAG: hypothetical protein EOP83_01150 [Verrucomicrobiaceae bacterium]